MSYTNGLDKPSDYFNTVLYTGNGSTQSITGVGFQPDFTWIKERTAPVFMSSHVLFDSIRGATKYLVSNDTAAEATSATSLTSFDSDGFSVGSNGANNESGSTLASWNWKANGAGVSNTAGSITSTVSASTTSGFSVVSWTGNSGTVGHGLGQKPACIIIKSRQSVNNWVVVHQGLGTMSGNVLVLNSTGAASGGGAGQVEPTANVFTITSGLASNDNNIGYVFAEKKGFSKFGNYTGNNSADGPFLYTGFKPAFVLIKATNAAQWWTLLDNKRDAYNQASLGLSPNSSNSESTFNTDRGPHYMDFVSNGFKIRTDNSGINGTNSFIYMAFAESPFTTSTGIPTTAR